MAVLSKEFEVKYGKCADAGKETKFVINNKNPEEIVETLSKLIQSFDINISLSSLSLNN